MLRGGVGGEGADAVVEGVVEAVGVGGGGEREGVVRGLRRGHEEERGFLRAEGEAGQVGGLVGAVRAWRRGAPWLA